MEITRFADLRPRTVWDVVDDSFDLYRSRLALLAGVSAVAYVPALLILLAISTGPFTRFVRESAKSGSGGADTATAALFQLLGVLFIAWPLLSIALSLQTGATAAVDEARLAGRDATIFSAWRRLFTGLRALFVTALGSGLLCGIAGALTSGFGELFLNPFFLYTPQAILLERQGVFGAFRRSSALAQYSYSKTLGLLLLCRLLGFFLGVGLLAIIILIVALIPTHDATTDQLADSGKLLALFVFGAGIALVLVAPLLGIASTLLYYDLRVRREGIDIEAAAVDIGYPIAPDYFGGVAANPTPYAPAALPKPRR